jgi:hypothetical protein
MKLLTLLLIFTFSFNSGAYEDFLSCYKTVEIDGQPVEQGPNAENSESEIFVVDNQFYRDLETNRELKTMIVSVFNGYREPWYGFSNIVIPVNKGKWEITQDSVRFSMDEDVNYVNSNYQRSKVDFLIDVEFKRDGKRLHGDLNFSSVRRGLFYDLEVVLEQAECL